VKALNEAAPRQAGLRLSEIVGGDLRLVLNNTMSAVEDGRHQILRYLEPWGVGSAARNRLEVVFEELVSNTIRHGFEPRSDQIILVSVAVRPGVIEIAFEDDGLPFNPLESPEPEPFSSLEEARLGGLGIPLILKLSTNVRYEPIPPGTAGHIIDGRPFNPCNRIKVFIANSA
jgi:serine/threonine-protein kinase RsbW